MDIHSTAPDLLRTLVRLAALASASFISVSHLGAESEPANRFNERKLFKHAERFYREATVLDPQFAEAHHALGLKLQEWGHLDEALVSYHRSVAADPNLPKARFILALALLERWGTSRAGEAIEHLQSAIRLEPDYLLAHYYLGLAFEQSGNRSGAAGAYLQALRINPNFGAARARLSSLGGRGTATALALEYLVRKLHGFPEIAEPVEVQDRSPNLREQHLDVLEDQVIDRNQEQGDEGGKEDSKPQ